MERGKDTFQSVHVQTAEYGVDVSIHEIAPDATLHEHKHPFARYPYVLAGTLRVTNTERAAVTSMGPATSSSKGSDKVTELSASPIDR